MSGPETGGVDAALAGVEWRFVARDLALTWADDESSLFDLSQVKRYGRNEIVSRHITFVLKPDILGNFGWQTDWVACSENIDPLGHCFSFWLHLSHPDLKRVDHVINRKVFRGVGERWDVRCHFYPALSLWEFKLNAWDDHYVSLDEVQIPDWLKEHLQTSYIPKLECWYRMSLERKRQSFPVETHRLIYPDTGNPPMTWQHWRDYEREQKEVA